MSYSFTVRASTKAELRAKIGAEFDRVVQTQPLHRRDRDQAEGIAFAFVALLADDPGKDVGVSVSGSLGWTGSEQEAVLTSANVSVTASSLAVRSPT